MAKLSVEERVNRGIALFESKGVDWSNLDYDILDVSDYFDCPLGQLFGTYPAGKDELKINQEAAARYGFDIYQSSADQVAEYHELTAEWRRRLSELSE